VIRLHFRKIRNWK